MQKLYILGLVLTTSFPVFSAENCVALDYQEMKEMKTEDLTKQYCSIHSNVRFYNTLGQFNSKMGEMKSQLADVSVGIAKLRNEREASKSNADSVAAYNIEEQCKSQRDRIGRVLAQKGVDEAALQITCGKPK
jgi:hypothetical protein